MSETCKYHESGDEADEPCQKCESCFFEGLIEFRKKFEVCDRCQGKGTHVNPSIDGHGITEEEWNGPDWDEESQEAYLSGAYDVQCYQCNGLRVVEVIDYDSLTEEFRKQVETWEMEAARDAASDRQTRYWESGGYDY